MAGLVLHSTLRPILGVTAVAGCLLFASVSHAQQAMTVEELEAFIKEKKEALSATEQDRDANLEKKEKLESMMAEQAERQEKSEQELRSLCDEREAAEPGSLSQCLSELNLVGN